MYLALEYEHERNYNNIYSDDDIKELRKVASKYLDEVHEYELVAAQERAETKTSLFDYRPKSTTEEILDASDLEFDCEEVIFTLNEIFGLSQKGKFADTVFESMLSLNMLKLRYSTKIYCRENPNIKDYTEPSDVGKLYLDALCKATIGTDESQRKRPDIMLKKVLSKIANKE
jgi:hypothetical protein